MRNIFLLLRVFSSTKLVHKGYIFVRNWSNLLLIFYIIPYNIDMFERSDKVFLVENCPCTGSCYFTTWTLFKPLKYTTSWPINHICINTTYCSYCLTSPHMALPLKALGYSSLLNTDNSNISAWSILYWWNTQYRMMMLNKIAYIYLTVNIGNYLKQLILNGSICPDCPFSIYGWEKWSNKYESACFEYKFCKSIQINIIWFTAYVF